MTTSDDPLFDLAVELKAQQAAWRARWPNHCKACRGWGLTSFSQRHAVGYTEEVAEPCDHQVDLQACHRCGQPGLDLNSEGPCRFCGWNFDDGTPML